jgi:hypothetical protein
MRPNFLNDSKHERKRGSQTEEDPAIQSLKRTAEDWYEVLARR